MKNKLNTL